jgi:hypothetical protein
MFEYDICVRPDLASIEGQSALGQPHLDALRDGVLDGDQISGKGLVLKKVLHFRRSPVSEHIPAGKEMVS